MTDAGMQPRPGSEYLYDALIDANIDVLIGLPGTQTLPFDRIVDQRDAMQYIMSRHETAVPHIAWGYYEASRKLAATITVPGPGDTNAMHGLKNALEDCVPLVHISPHSHPDERGKGPIHEIEPNTFDTVLKENINVRDPLTLQTKIQKAIQTATTPPYGPVRLGIPSSMLDTEFWAPPAAVSVEQTVVDNEEAYQQATTELSQAERPVVYIGGGGRRSEESPAAIKQLVEELNAPVVSTFKGKGIFPEDHPNFMGITGSMLPNGARKVLEDADVVAAFGTDFDGPATANWELPMGTSLVHVNLSNDDMNQAYEADLPIVDDAGVAAQRLYDGVSRRTRETWDGAEIGTAVQEEYRRELAEAGLFNGNTPINTPEAMTIIREELPRETTVAVDVGGFRLWSLETFEAYEPEQFICAGSWGGMGVGLPAAIGAKLATPDAPVACLTGDGGLMMCIHELHTAAELGLDIIVIVFNNNDYGVISNSLADRQENDERRFTWETPDFEMIAKGFGCKASEARTIDGLHDTVSRAIERQDGPELIDVYVDGDEPSAVNAASYESTIDI